MEFTGERYVPAVDGQIKYEHLHRYALSMEFVAGKSVLDLASGEGYGAALLAQVAKAVIGVDISSTSVEHAKHKYYYQNLKFLVGSCESVPLQDASVDVVTSFETIEHHSKHEEMMLEIKRVLKRDGILIISSPNRLTYSDEPCYSNPFHVKELYYDELYDLLSRHFKNIQLYGQRLATGSFVFPLQDAHAESYKAFTGSAMHLTQSVSILPSPIYFIAVCSDSMMVERSSLDSIYIDNDDLLKTFETQMRQTVDELATARKGYELQIIQQTEEMSKARDGYEAQINKITSELMNARTVYEAQILQLTTNLSEIREAYEMQLRHKAEQVEEKEEIIREQSEALASAQDKLAELQNMNQQLAASNELLTVQVRNKEQAIEMTEQGNRSEDTDSLIPLVRQWARHSLRISALMHFARFSLARARGFREDHGGRLPYFSELPTVVGRTLRDWNKSTTGSVTVKAVPLPVSSQIPPVLEVTSGDQSKVNQDSERDSPLRAQEADNFEQYAQFGEVIDKIENRIERSPSILNWITGLNLSAAFPHLAVFSPSTSNGADRLPYLDNSIDIVILASTDPYYLAEARRVASVAVVRASGLPFNRLHQLTAGKGFKSRITLQVEWKVDELSEASLASSSIIIPVHNKSTFTQNCLEQLLSTLPDNFRGEIVIVDDASTDDTPTVLGRWAERDKRIKVLRNVQNMGFINSCNRGAEMACGEILVFLNNDTLPQPGWLQSLLRVLRDYPDAGAVGGKLIYPNGTLQEAGGVIFSDGSGCNFGRNDKFPNAPLYNFLREVDYCSGALLATPRALFTEIGGFDPRFAPAYYEDTDYCFSVREKGRRVYYQPESVIIHFEGISSGTDINSGIKSYQAVNRIKFVDKWKHVLRQQPSPPEEYDFATLHALSVRNGVEKIDED